MQDLVVIDNMENDNGTKDMTDIEEAYTMGSKKNVDEQTVHTNGVNLMANAENDEFFNDTDNFYIEEQIMDMDFGEQVLQYKGRKVDVVLENEAILNDEKKLERAGILKDIEPEVVLERSDCEDIEIVTRKNTDLMSGLGIDMVQNTQTRVELEIDKHYEEEPYMTSFENNLKEFVDVYERCLNNCEVSLALFPQNLRLAKLKKEYSQYFKMFEATSPIAKKLLVGNVVHDAGKKSAILDNSDFVPSYSLGLSQLTPKNLLSDLKGIGNSQLQGSSGSVSLVGKGQPVPKVVDEKGAHYRVGDKRIVTTKMVRPR
ncbi:uncharacterized protein LOC141681014 [Apium graveolens]|uniref:uncharacterized protein LOC141681014 n=2 Tax=Apium graveolens TaxID=4045 RepID=UPI003D78E8FB